MVTPYWPFDVELNPNRLATKFVALHQQETEFSMLTGEHYTKYWGYAHKTAKDSETPRPNGSMVSEYFDLKSGGTDILVPVIVPPQDMPVFGDTPVTNLGTTSDVVYQRAEINQINYTHAIVTGMQYQTLGNALANKINEAADALRYRFTRYTDKDLYHTVFNGVSMQLTTLSGIQGARSTLTPHSHANFYLPSISGLVSYAGGRPGSAGYEASVETGLNGIGANDVFSTDLIQELEYQADELLIPSFETKFGDFRILLISTAAYKQLQNDTKYIAAKQAASNGLGWNGLEFRNFRGQWSNTLIFTTPRMPGVQVTGNTLGQPILTNSSFNGIPKYGPSTFYTSLEARDTSPIKLGIMCGPNMLTKAYGNTPVKFEGEIRVGEQKQILIMRAMHAYVLSDIYDLDGHIEGLTKGDLYKNTSSLVFATASPSN